MTVSDLLTIIGIILAIVALISDRNRQFIFLKFTTRDWGLILIAFALVHVLVSYNWFSNQIAVLSYLEISGFPEPSAWAYIITVGTLAVICLKIFYLKFPIGNRENVLSFYKNLLYNDDSTLLLDQIEKYHSQDIVEFLKLRKSIDVEEEEGFLAYRREYERREEELQKKLKQKSNLKYGRTIYHGIITNELFLKKYATVRPYLFTPILKELNDDKVKNSDFANNFLRYLCLNKNELFFREIRNNQNFANFESYRIEDQRQILYALFNKIKVASLNEAFSGVGEPAIAELHEESHKSHSLLRDRETERIEELDTIWSFRITIAIWYFDIMVRESIVQEENKHMWMFYYRFFVKGLINNMDDEEVENSRSRNYDLIRMIFEKMRGWLKVSKLAKNPNLVDSIYSCIGECINELMRNDKLSTEDKTPMIRSLWHSLIYTLPDDQADEDEIAIVDQIVTSGFEMLLEPSTLISPQNMDQARREYEEILVSVWENRDQPAIEGPVEENAEQFRVNVIDQIR